MPPANLRLPCAMQHVSGVSYGSRIPGGSIVVPLGPEEPQPVPSKRTDSGCKGVAEGAFRRLAKGSQNTISLQIVVDRAGSNRLTSAVQTQVAGDVQLLDACTARSSMTGPL